MKFIFCITVFFLTYASNTFCQSEFYFDEGSDLTLDQGSELTADVIIINGSFSGGGTINGNPAYVLSLTAFIEGFYNYKCDCMISDTVRAYLRNISSPYSIVDSSIAKLSASGNVTFIFSNAGNVTSYYLVLKHRNSIETWSSSGISFELNSDIYDFSTAITQAFGNNMKLVNDSPERYAFYSGDVNQDGIIDAGDISQVENDASASLYGYVQSDVNGDNFIDAGDLAIVENNANLSVSVLTP